MVKKITAKKKNNKKISRKKANEHKVTEDKIITKKTNRKRKRKIKHPKKKNKLNLKPIIIIIISLIILSVLGASAYFIINNHLEKQEQIRRDNLVAKITSNYSEYVVTTSEANLYQLENNEYQHIGTVGINVNLKLKESNITYQTKYFQLADLDYYIEYDKVTPSNEPTIDKRYQSYIVFNNNIITNDKVTFYDASGNHFMTLNKSLEFPIIIKESDRYGVEFYNQLLYINKSDVSETIKVTNTKENARTNIRTLTYHTAYQKGKEKCTNIYVCHPIEQFEEHMKYIHEKNYLTLTMEELEMFLDGQIRIPKKSIVITLDDGKYLHNSVPIVEKYQIHATFFIITSKFSIEKYQDSQYAHFESHTDNLHHNYVCNSGYYGGQMLCENYDKIIADLKLSQEKLGGSKYFAYPFFDSNTRAIKALRETGFKLAFIGQYDTDGYSTPKTDRYQLRRKTVFGDDSLSTLIKYISA